MKVIITCCDPPWLLHPLCFTQLQGYLSTPSCCQDHLHGAYLWLDGCCSVKAIGIKRCLPLIHAEAEEHLILQQLASLMGMRLN